MKGSALPARTACQAAKQTHKKKYERRIHSKQDTQTSKTSPRMKQHEVSFIHSTQYENRSLQEVIKTKI